MQVQQESNRDKSKCLCRGACASMLKKQKESKLFNLFIMSVLLLAGVLTVIGAGSVGVSAEETGASDEAAAASAPVASSSCAATTKSCPMSESAKTSCSSAATACPLTGKSCTVKGMDKKAADSIKSCPANSSKLCCRPPKDDGEDK